jgi:hypothetical protein
MKALITTPMFSDQQIKKIANGTSLGYRQLGARHG